MIPGDVILSINGYPPGNAAANQRALAAGQGQITIVVSRLGNTLTLTNSGGLVPQTPSFQNGDLSQLGSYVRMYNDTTRAISYQIRWRDLQGNWGPYSSTINLLPKQWYWSGAKGKLQCNVSYLAAGATNNGNVAVADQSVGSRPQENSDARLRQQQQRYVDCGPRR